MFRILSLLLLFNVSFLLNAQKLDTVEVKKLTNEPISIDELLQLKKKDKNQYKLLENFKNQYKKEDIITVEEFKEYYELTVSHESDDGMTGGAECYKIDKQTGEQTLLWHEHPMEIEDINVDTLFYESYVSDAGNKITKGKDELGGLYTVEVNSAKGFAIKFEVAGSQYLALHTNILWDNEDYVFIHYGCGTECWGAKLLPLNKKEKVRIFKEYLFTDKTRNIIVYPDEADTMNFIVENVKTKKSIARKLEICKEGTSPAQMMKKIYFSDNQLVMEYFGEDCFSILQEIVELDL